MAAQMSPDDMGLQVRRFRSLALFGMAIMLIFCVISVAQLLGAPGLISALSLATDASLTLLLLALYRWSARMSLATAATIVGVAILFYSILNLLFFPEHLVRLLCGPLLAVTIALSYVDSRVLRYLSAAAWLTIAVLFAVTVQARMPDEPLIDFAALMALTAIILFALNQFHARINAALDQARAANDMLRATRADLERQVAERTATLQEALAGEQARAAELAILLAETEEQRRTIRALSIPVLPVSHKALAVPLVGAFDAQRVADLQQTILDALERSGAQYVVVDVTGVSVIDRETAAGLVRVARAARLLGANVVLAGIRPEVAQALVSLGSDLGSLSTAATLQDGIAQALK